MRLDDVDGIALDGAVVDAASVNRIVQQAAAMGQRLYSARPSLGLVTRKAGAPASQKKAAGAEKRRAPPYTDVRGRLACPGPSATAASPAHRDSGGPGARLSRRG